MHSNRLCTLTQQAYRALIDARHSDVFSVLGMHQSKEDKGLVIRALLPEATKVEVVDANSGKVVAELAMVDAAGLFEGKAGRRRKRFQYRLRVSYPHEQVELDDPYAFSSLLQQPALDAFARGDCQTASDWMGCHLREVDGIGGAWFVLWAPKALRVSVVGDFNHWDGRRHVMRRHADAGIWEIFVPGVGARTHYKYELLSAEGELLPLKSDPYAFAMQRPPNNASVTTGESVHRWQDQAWMTSRADRYRRGHGPVSIYEVHVGSWRRVMMADGTNRYLTYRELAQMLIPYVLEMGFTHIQLMPLSEYPFDGSWGYQPIGLFAPTSRFGSADDFKYFVDCCHQQGLGVLFDWVAGHFPSDHHGIGQLDGSCLYEHHDSRQGLHPEWNTLIYDYGRNQVCSYLLSNAHYWLREYHLDGLRVDAVSSMLYLDYAREEAQWVPNENGGRENLAAVSLLKMVNQTVGQHYPGVMMVAEESSDWHGVTHPVSDDGLGFGYKWNMGWMHDTLQYMNREMVQRRHFHGEMTFGIDYAFNERYILPLSHDEVVHAKGSLLGKMPGDEWQRFAGLRAYYGFMWTHPGKKLLFMGGEFAQRNEWDHDNSLDWHLLQSEPHAGVQRLIKDLNRLYRQLPALYERDHDPEGFLWLDNRNSGQSIFAYMRKGNIGSNPALVVVNMTPQTHSDYRLGVPFAGFYRECLNSDSGYYGGCNVGNLGGVSSICNTHNGFPYELHLTVAPLAVMVFEWQGH